tara:strand:+ start:12966 stop:13487 length:522 start_codon:yes stop_codon:yes gene_type:complete
MSRAKRARKAQSRKEITVATPPWDQGAMGPANRHRLREEPATEIDPETGKETPNPNNVRRWRRDSHVALFAKAGKLDHRQAAAAEKLVLAAEGLKDRDPLAALDEIRVRGGGDPQAARVDARRYFRQLWDDVPTASRPVIERVVLDDKPLWHGNPAQRERHMQRLRDGLDAIA